jgi:hypothetical protein
MNKTLLDQCLLILCSIEGDKEKLEMLLKFMEEKFVESLPDGTEKIKLSNAIENNKPFANFNRLIHSSEERENWFKSEFIGLKNL